MSLNFNFQRLLIPAAVSLIVFFVLNSYTGPPGIDGFFYLKQIETLANGEVFYFKDYSLAFYLPVVITAFLNDALFAFRLSIFLTWFVLVLSVYSITLGLNQGLDSSPAKRIKVYVAVAIMLVSSISIHELCFSYYKNFFGVTLLIASIALWLNPYGRTVSGKVISIILLLAALFSHKSTFLIVLMMAFSYLINHLSKRNVLLFTAMLTVLLLLFIAFFERGGYYLTALFTFFDTPRKWGLWISHIFKNDLPIFVTIIFSLSSVLFYLRERETFSLRAKVFMDAVAMLVIFTLLPFHKAGPSSPAYRMIILSPLFTIPVFLHLYLRCEKKVVLILIIGTAFISQAAFLDQMLNSFFPNWSPMDEDVKKIRSYVNKDDHLVTHHGLEFYIDYHTGIRARQFLNSRPDIKTFRLAYIPYGRPGGKARNALNKVMLAKIGDDYGLFREADWDRLTKEYNISPHWKNPEQFRPAYIYD